MAPGAIYTPDERSTGVRLNKRSRYIANRKLSHNNNAHEAKYEEDLVHGIINSAPILHVSFNAPVKDGPPFPTILPMLGAIGQFGEDEEAHVYLHGSSVARLFTLTSGSEVPLCVCGTILDGYVMALAPFHNSCNYRAAVVFGYGIVLENEKEILYGLELITNNTMVGSPQIIFS